jgi:hypothetical protein
MFLGNDTVTVEADGEDITVSGCNVTPDGKVLVPHPLEGQQLVVVLADGRRFTARDVVSWYDAAGVFDHAEGLLEEVGDGRSPD